MIWLPTPLKGFTDALPEIKAMLRVCAFYLYGWVCEHPSVADEAAKVASGWMPDGYPKSWPSANRPGIMPPGTAPYSERIQREIEKRKQNIKLSLQNPDLFHYPRDGVRAVLSFWKIELE